MSFSSYTRLKYINKIDCSFRRSHVVVRLVRFYLLAAPGALKAVIACIGITQTNFCLKIPMPSQYPRITISDTCADIPTLITGILQLAGIRAKEVDLSIKTSDIILSAMNVSTHKVSREAIAEPVSDFF